MKKFLEFINEADLPTKTAQTDNSPVNKPEFIADPAHLLRKQAAVRNAKSIGYGKSSVSGRGIYATDDIAKGDIVEEAPYIQVDKESIKGTPLMDYVFKIDDTTYAVALGYASLFNHRNQPNVDWKIDTVDQVIRMTAIKDLEQGEELFISYGNKYWSSRDTDMTKDI